MTESRTKPGVAKLLIVDDLEENLLALAALMRRDDVDVLTAKSGREALELLLVHDVALAILDVQMPGMDGFELAELIRGVERTRRVPIIFVTAGSHDEVRVFQGYDAGAVDFLFKPLDARIVRHKVEVFLQLYHQRKALEDTLRLSDELVAIVGHDLRNPLNAILLSADLLADGESPPVHKLALQLQSSARRMQQIIEEVLDLSRARHAGGIPTKRYPVDLLVVATKIVDELETAYPSHQITLRSSGDLHGEWDGERFGQVLSNLIGNALRHGTSGGTVVLDLDGRLESEVYVSVHNDGDIAQDIMSALFEPFSRSKPERVRTEGLGLGLYIANQIVLAHGGTIEVSSGRGEGTTFRVRVPRRST